VKWLVAACLALGALSLLLPLPPGNDAWAWLVWGREVVHLDLDTSVGASWKPLPILFTAPFSLLGELAPALWTVVARTGGLLGLALAFRLAYRLARSGRRPGRNEQLVAIGAGVLAAVPLALMLEHTTLGGKAGVGYLSYMAYSRSEGLLVAFLLWAVDRELDGRRDQALVLGLLASLIRPEVWPFLVGYGLFVALREPRRRWLVAAVLLLVPALWILPEWWGSGDPLGAGTKAARSASVSETAGSPPVVLERMNALLIAPVKLAALAAVGFAAWRREAMPLALTAGVALWVAGAAVGTLFGYPGLARFLVPAAGVVFVLAGLGAARIVQAVGAGRPALALGVILALAAAPFAEGSVRRLPDLVESGQERAAFKQDLAGALAHTGGRQAVLPCGRPVIAGFFSRYATRLRAGLLDRLWPRNYMAWELRVPMSQVRRRGPPAGSQAIVFQGGRRELGVGPPRPVAPEQEVRQVAEVGVWQVFVFADPSRPPPGCDLV
jgi:hypothetical protein